MVTSSELANVLSDEARLAAAAFALVNRLGFRLRETGPLRAGFVLGRLPINPRYTSHEFRSASEKLRVGSTHPGQKRPFNVGDRR